MSSVVYVLNNPLTTENTGLHRENSQSESSGSHLFCCPATLAQRADAECVVPLRKPCASFVADQITVIEVRDCPSKSAIQEKLTCRGLQQVSSAHNLRNSNRVIVRHDCQLVCGNIVSAPNHEIAEVATCDESLFSEMQIEKRDLLAFRNTKPPIHSGGLVMVSISCATRSRINRLIIEMIGRSNRGGQVFS